MMQRPIKPGDTLGPILTVHTAERILQAQRDGKFWRADVSGPMADVLRRKGWRDAPSGSVPAPAPAPAVSTYPILDGTVSALAAELDSGTHDAYLVDLLAAEMDNKNRSTAISAIEDRIEDVQG
jgi:hypothetical protein